MDVKDVIILILLGPILKCSSCHESSRKREDVSIPDLKGAYHRQCMDCHREWSHETGCNSCHTPKKDLKDVKKDNITKEICRQRTSNSS